MRRAVFIEGYSPALNQEIAEAFRNKFDGLICDLSGANKYYEYNYLKKTMFRLGQIEGLLQADIPYDMVIFINQIYVPMVNLSLANGTGYKTGTKGVEKTLCDRSILVYAPYQGEDLDFQRKNDLLHKAYSSAKLTKFTCTRNEIFSLINLIERLKTHKMVD